MESVLLVIFLLHFGLFIWACFKLLPEPTYTRQQKIMQVVIALIIPLIGSIFVVLMIKRNEGPVDDGFPKGSNDIPIGEHHP